MLGEVNMENNMEVKTAELTTTDHTPNLGGV
jgi:hypothetical protein